MTGLARSERAALCDTALQVGEDRPTLSGAWTVKDLVVHLLVREGSPAALGLVLAPLEGLLEAEYRRVRRRDFADLVERLRHGPPRLSPYAVPKLDALANTLEFFVQHEDIRRAQPHWTPRDLDDESERRLWSMVATIGKRLTRSAPVGVLAEDSTSGSTAVLTPGSPAVTVRGRPGEVVLYVFGRSPHTRVELLGEDDAVARLRGASLGV
jgi:uncharacterized protein (TIGR03085 family)